VKSITNIYVLRIRNPGKAHVVLVGGTLGRHPFGRAKRRRENNSTMTLGRL
jgi:hypothetical protein